jgi:AcrR family transcriptional regulator
VAGNTSASRGTRQRGGRQSRRDEILAAAIDLLATSGTRGTTLESIAQQIGVTRAAITHHFGTKDVLLSEVVALAAARDDLTASSREDETGLERLSSLRTHGQALIANPEIATVSRLGTVLTVESYDPGSAARDAYVNRNRLYRDGIAAMIRRGQRDGTIRTDIDPRDVGAEISAFMMGASILWFVDPRRVDLVEIYDTYFERLIADVAVGD